MPKIFLSPSTQDYNSYVNGGNEALYANLIADAMEPYLRASGIDFTRNDPNGNVSTSIAASNAGNYDLHLAIHSNAAPANLAGMLRGSDVYYYRDSTRSRAAAEIFANNLKADLSQSPDLVAAVPTTTLAELRRTAAPAVLVEVAYHDNIDDANWITGNIEKIAENLALCRRLSRRPASRSRRTLRGDRFRNILPQKNAESASFTAFPASCDIRGLFFLSFARGRHVPPFAQFLLKAESVPVRRLIFGGVLNTAVAKFRCGKQRFFDGIATEYLPQSAEVNTSPVPCS